LLYQAKQDHDTLLEIEDREPLVEYLCFDNLGVEEQSVIGIVQEFGVDAGGDNRKKGPSAEALSLHLDDSLVCVDLALYKVCHQFMLFQNPQFHYLVLS
jgi:hypothetical protein